MPDDRPLVEQVLDAVLYAPIGAAVTAAEQLPGLVEKGRARLEPRVALARLIGRAAVSSLRQRAERDLFGEREPGSAGDPGPTPSGRGAARARQPDERDAAPVPPVSPGPSPAAHDLAIPGYDSLAASQVVQRLGALSSEELDAVARYEEANRARRTVLGRIAQLRGEGGDRA